MLSTRPQKNIVDALQSFPNFFRQFATATKRSFSRQNKGGNKRDVFDTKSQ